MSIPKPSVAIIGGGASGLSTARVLSRNGLKPVVLEKDAEIGGVWNYKPKSTTSPMYKNLRTNLPKEIMAFREFPWPSKDSKGNPIRDSYLPHRQVQEYLCMYRDHFKVNQYIQYNSIVKQLTVTSEKSILSPSQEEWNKIKLEWTSAASGSSYSQTFDAVCICNGHYSLPAIPDLPGMENFLGTTIHSIGYDDPADFKGKTVLCIGGRASGADLAREIAKYGKHVYLSDSVTPPKKDGKFIEEDNVSWLPKTVGIRDDGSIEFENCSISPTVDTIIFCTGYDYQFPFINDRSNLELDAAVGSRRVSPLFQQLWHAEHPNLMFSGLPHSVVPFPLFELQAEATWSQWSNWQLPLRQERMDAAAKDANSGGEGKENGRLQDTHFLGDAQWDYKRRMAKFAGIYDEETENFISTSKAIYDHSGSERKGQFPGDEDIYRETVYKRKDKSQSFALLRSLVSKDIAVASSAQ